MTNHVMHASSDNVTTCSIAVQQLVNRNLYAHMPHVRSQLLWLARLHDRLALVSMKLQ